MIRFALGLALIFFTLIVGTYFIYQQKDVFDARQFALEDALDKRTEGKALQKRIRELRNRSMVAGDDQKFTIERRLDIGAPGMEWRFIGQPRLFGNNRALYRYTFRIAGPATYDEAQELLRKLVTNPGYVPYRFCFACSQPPRGTPENLRVVQIEGYLYVYDPSVAF